MLNCYFSYVFFLCLINLFSSCVAVSYLCLILYLNNFQNPSYLFLTFAPFTNKFNSIFFLPPPFLTYLLPLS